MTDTLTGNDMGGEIVPTDPPEGTISVDEALAAAAPTPVDLLDRVNDALNLMPEAKEAIDRRIVELQEQRQAINTEIRELREAKRKVERLARVAARIEDTPEEPEAATAD